MKKSTRSLLMSTLVLAVALAFLGGVYLLSVKPSRDKAAQKGKEPLVPDFIDDDVAQIESRFRDVDTNRMVTNRFRTVITNRGGRWYVVYPVSDMADTGNVRGLLSDLRAIRSTGIFKPAGVDAVKEYGFDDPSSELLLTFQDGRKSMVRNGRLAATENLYYSVTSDTMDRIYTVFAYLFTPLERESWYFRDKELFNIPVLDVTLLEFTGADGRLYRFERPDASREEWFMRSPLRVKADAFAVKSKILEFLSVKASEYSGTGDQASAGKGFSYRALLASPGKTNILYVENRVNESDQVKAYSPDKEGLVLIDVMALSNRFSADSGAFIKRD